MPPRPKFTREHLQAAALALADTQGLAALSMRSLAAQLGTGAMTLYNYVRDRDELDALVVDAVMAEARWPPPSGDWQRDVREIATAMWRAVRGHPNVIPLILNRRSLHEATLEPAEALLRALSESGRAGPELLAAFRAVSGFVLALAQAQLAGPTAREHDARDATIARVQTLPPERFPKLIEIAGAAVQTPPEQELQLGLDIVLAGLARQRDTHPRNVRKRTSRSPA